jgi:hypothetical protein
VVTAWICSSSLLSDPLQLCLKISKGSTLQTTNQTKDAHVIE